MAQWLRVRASSAGGVGLNPGQVTKTYMSCGKKKRTKASLEKDKVELLTINIQSSFQLAMAEEKAESRENTQNAAQEMKQNLRKSPPIHRDRSAGPQRPNHTTKNSPPGHPLKRHENTHQHKSLNANV